MNEIQAKVNPWTPELKRAISILSDLKFAKADNFLTYDEAIKGLIEIVTILVDMHDPYREK